MDNDADRAATRTNRPIFVLGERPAAMELVRALGELPAVCAMPPIRLLADLVLAVDRCASQLRAPDGLQPARWYEDVQAAQLRVAGRLRTVEFSGLPILRLCSLFPTAQFVVVRHLARRVPRSRRPPVPGQGRILEVDSEEISTPGTLERILAFLGDPAEPVVVDLSDDTVGSSR